MKFVYSIQNDYFKKIITFRFDVKGIFLKYE